MRRVLAAFEPACHCRAAELFGNDHWITIFPRRGHFICWMGFCCARACGQLILIRHFFHHTVSAMCVCVCRVRVCGALFASSVASSRRRVVVVFCVHVGASTKSSSPSSPSSSSIRMLPPVFIGPAAARERLERTRELANRARVSI